MTAFNGHVMFPNQGGMLVATAYRLGEDFNSSFLPTLDCALRPPSVYRVSYVDSSLFLRALQ